MLWGKWTREPNVQLHSNWRTTKPLVDGSCVGVIVIVSFLPESCRQPDTLEESGQSLVNE
jgi:hypothetical protein